MVLTGLHVSVMASHYPRLCSLYNHALVKDKGDGAAASSPSGGYYCHLHTRQSSSATHVLSSPTGSHSLTAPSLR